MSSDAGQRWPPGDSEMAGRVRDFDWAATSLGPSEQWPAALRCAVLLSLESAFPMCIFAGPDFVLLYNDAHIPALGEEKHPQALGRAARQVWEEVWHELGPALTRVVETGLPVHGHDQRFLIRRAGQLEETFWTYSRSPIRDERGTVIGVHNPATETTARVRAEVALRESEANFRRLFGTMGQGYAQNALIRDAAGNVVDLTYLELNPAFERLIGMPVEQARGRRVCELFPHTDRFWLESYDRIVRAGQPERLEHQHGGRWFEAWVYPRGSDQVTVLYEDITDRKCAEAALRESEAKYRSLFESMDEGFALCELVRDGQGVPIDYRYLELNRALAAQSGLSPESLRGRLARETFSDFDPALLEIYAKVVKDQESITLERYYASVHRWLRINAFPRDADRFAVLYTDVTDRKRAEQRQAFLLELSDTLRELADPFEIERQATSVLGRHLGASRVFYAEVLPGDTHAVIHRDYTHHVASYVGTYPVDAFGPVVDQLRAGMTVKSDDTFHDPRIGEAERPTYEAGQVRAFVGVPLVKAGRLAAVFTVHMPAPYAWSAHEIALVEEAAERTWAAAQRARAEATLRQSEAKYSSAFDAMDEGFCMIEPVADGSGQVVDLVIRETNRAFELQSGLCQASGRRVSALPPTFARHWLEAYARVVRTGVAERVESHVADVDRWFSVFFTPVGGEGSRHVAVLFSDITLRKREAQERERLLAVATEVKSQAEAANRAKDEFLATLSHELRTPLAPILLWSRALRHGGVRPQDLERAFAAIVESAESQARLIEDLLDLSRLQSGKLTLELRSISVETLARAALEVIRPTAEAKGVQLQAEVAPGLGEIRLDPGRMQQVLWNLLSNAVKFTPRGGEVCLRVRRDGSQLLLEVADTGQGIEPSFLPHMFQRFRQAETGDTRRYGGLGIGLALCRSLVELHGGTIAGHSSGRGHGTVFTVRIPWQQPAQPSDEPATGVAGTPSLQGVRVLLVEDDAHTREVMAWTLLRAGAEVVTAASGSEALAVIQEPAGPPVSVIVCDIGMAELSGYDLIAAISAARDAAGLPAIPACAVSAHAREVDRRRAIEAGFELFLAKPIRAEELIDAVGELARPA